MSKHTIQELQTNIDYLNTTKSMLKNAIINKGQSISESDTFRDYADKISAITTSTKVVLPDKLKFSGSSQVQSFDFLNDCDTSNLTVASNFFYGCQNLKSAPLFDTSNVTDMSQMFYNNYNLTSVPLFDTSKVTDMSNMFRQNTSLTTVPLFNTSSVTNMASMFYACTSLTSVPLFDTSNVKDIGNMFYNCGALITVPVLLFPKVTSFSGVFNNCSNLSNESLNNILQICINMLSAQYVAANRRTLSYIGLSSTQAATCQTLSSWDAFIAANWTSGY